MKRAVLCFRYRRYYSSSTLTRVVLNETQMELAIIFTPVPCSTLTRVVLNETNPRYGIGERRSNLQYPHSGRPK